MKFNNVAAAAAMLAGVAHADDAEAAKVAPELPSFTVRSSPASASPCGYRIH